MANVSYLENLKNYFQTKEMRDRIKLHVLIWCAYTATILWGLIGRRTGALDGEVLEHYGLFFTYQSTWIMYVGFSLILLYELFQWDWLEWTNEHWFRGMITSYITLTMLIASFVMVPVIASGQWENASIKIHNHLEQLYQETGWKRYKWAMLDSANPDSVNANILWGAETTLIHFIFPLFFAWDYITIDQSRVFKRPRFRHAALWAIYPFQYFLTAIIIGSITGWYPYPILSPIGFGHSWIGYAILIGVVYVLETTVLLLSKTRFNAKKRGVEPEPDIISSFKDDMIKIKNLMLNMSIHEQKLLEEAKFEKFKYIDEHAIDEKAKKLCKKAVLLKIKAEAAQKIADEYTEAAKKKREENKEDK